MKRISRIICIAMFILLLAVEVFAAKSGKCGDNITWEFSGNTLTLSGSGAMDDYESNNIPWFDYRLDIKEIIIDDRITAIGDYAFYHCSQFKDITFPSNLETVGRMAFFDCYALGNINLPSTVHTIGEDAFAGTRIDKVCLPKNLENLSSGAFSRCSRLKAFELDPENEYFEVVDGVLYDWKKHRLYAYPAGKEDAVFTVPDGVYYITASAFQNCKNLQTLIFPDGIESIGNFAFYGSANLESIYIPDSLDRYGSLLFHTDVSVTIYGVKETKAEELANEYKLDFSTDEVPVNTVDFTYKDGILTVHGKGAIRSYTPGQAPWYDHHAEAEKVIIKEGITKISFGAFHGFYYVEEVEIPASVEIIEEFFQNCDNLKNYYVSEDNDNYLTDNGIIFSKDKKKIVRYPEGRKDVHYSIPDSVVEICDDAFNSAQFETVEIPDSVKTIGNNAFLNCSRLSAVRIPSGVTELKTYSFNCKNLNGIYIPKSVKKITNAFGSTKNLTIYGEKGSYAAEYAKKNGIKFSTEEMPDTFFSWIFEDGVLTVKCVGEMENYNTHNNPAPWMVHQNEIKEVILVDGVTTVGKYAFDQCRLLKKVTLPETVTKINTGAFAFCDSLSEIDFPDGIATIWPSAFYGCDSLSDIELPSEIEKIYEDAFSGCGIKELTLPDSLEFIGSRAFAMCDNLQTVFIPKNVSKMGDFPFLMCNGLVSIEVHPNNKHFSSEGGVLLSKDKTELLGYPPGNTAMIYVVPEYVKIIGNRAFYGDMYLKSVIFHDDIKEFGENVFAYNIFFTVHASKGSVTEKYALENNVQFLPTENVEEAKVPLRLYDVLIGIQNFKSSKQINTLLTQLRLLAE